MKENNIYKGDLKFVRVSFSDINNLNNKIFIDFGIEDNIKIDMIIVYGDYLVGKIVVVYDNYFEVEFIINFNCIISVKIMGDVLGIVRGSDEEDGFLYFQFLIVEDNLKEGDEIIILGISDIYLEGIKIGKIEQIDEKENYGYKRVILKLGFESKDLRELIVISRENVVNRLIVKEEVKELKGDEK